MRSDGGSGPNGVGPETVSVGWVQRCSVEVSLPKPTVEGAAFGRWRSEKAGDEDEELDNDWRRWGGSEMD